MQHTGTSEPLDTDVKKVAEAEASIEKRLETTRKKADEIIANARAQRLETLEKTEELATKARAEEVEKIRKEVAVKCQEITRQAQGEAAKIQSAASRDVTKKLLEEFKTLVAKEARG